MSAGCGSALAPGRARRRRGFGLVEMAVAGVLLLAIILITVQLVGWTLRDRQMVARREAGLRLVGDAMERVLAQPFDAITPAGLAPLVADLTHGQPRSAGTLRVEVSAAEPVDGHGQKRVVVEVRWPDAMAGVGAPVRLVAWTTDRGRMQP